MKCPGCGQVIDETRFSADIAFCPHCGQDIKAAGNASRLQFCPYCGQKLESLTNFCPNCGKKLTVKEKSAGHPAGGGDTFIERTTKAIKNTFGRERQIRKLYKQWAEFSNLPPDEVPSMDELRGMTSPKKGRKQDSDE